MRAPSWMPTDDALSTGEIRYSAQRSDQTSTPRTTRIPRRRASHAHHRRSAADRDAPRRPPPSRSDGWCCNDAWYIDTHRCTIGDGTSTLIDESDGEPGGVEPVEHIDDRSAGELGGDGDAAHGGDVIGRPAPP